MANGNFATPIKKPTAAKASRNPLNVSLLDEKINFVLNCFLILRKIPINIKQHIPLKKII